MTVKHVALLPIVFAAPALAQSTARAADAQYHHVHITAASPSEAVGWYAKYLDCAPAAGRNDAADCGGVELVFVAQATMGGTQGTGVNHIGFAYADLAAKMAELEAVGVRGSGVRLQRFDDGSTLRDVPGLFKHGFIFDPWGTRIELVEDSGRQGFHHVHLSAADPAAALAWYRETFGGKAGKLRGKLDGLLLGNVWLLAAQHPAGAPAPTRGRAVDHIGFALPNLSEAARKLRKRGVAFQEEPAVPENARSSAKRAYLVGPDSVRIAFVEPGFAGVETAPAAAAAREEREPYDVPRTPWGEPDLQGVWTGNAAHGIPLERPLDLADVQALTAEQAAARRERGTLGSIWGYEREWRDTTLDYDKMTPSRQVAMIVDPPDGRLPEMTPDGKRIAEEARRARERYTKTPPAGPEDMTPYVRCITRGLPGMMMPSIYNNGLQIVQGPRLRRHPEGNDPRNPRHPHQTAAAGRPETDDVAGRPARALGGRRAGHRDEPLQWQKLVPRIDRRHEADRARYAHRPDEARIPLHRRRPGRLGPSLDRPIRLRPRQRPVRAGRVRLPRGQLRHVQHSQRRQGKRQRGCRRRRTIIR